MEYRLAAVLAASSRQVVAGIALLVLTLGGQAGSSPTREDPVLAAVCAVAMERLISYGAPESECGWH